jgi:SAM-dependent methyltransferase
MGEQSCFLCERVTPIEQLYVFGSYTVQRCRRCSLEFLHPQPEIAELSQLYDKGYFCSEDSQTRGYDLYEAEEANLRKTFRRRLAVLSDYLPGQAPRRVLDVGCALGYFLAVAAEGGWEAKGVEISAWAAAEARRRFGLAVQQGGVETADFPPATFDLITMWDVLEHLPNPRNTLLHCHELLKEGGYLALTTPNTGGLLRKLTNRNWVEYKKIPEHLYFFNPSTIRTLLEKSGFLPISIRSKGKYVNLAFFLKRLAEAWPLLSPLHFFVHLPGLRRFSFYTNATNIMLVIAQKEASAETARKIALAWWPVK